jgi:hypothetical protein
MAEVKDEISQKEINSCLFFFVYIVSFHPTLLFFYLSPKTFSLNFTRERRKAPCFSNGDIRRSGKLRPLID